MTPFVQALAEALALSQDAIFAGFAVFLRVGAAMALLPAFGERMVPARIKLVLALSLTLLTAPAVIARYPDIGGLDAMGALIATETLAGLAVGAVLRLFVMTLQIAGSVAAQSVSLSQILGGQAIDPQPAMGHVIVLAGLCLAVMSGLHVRVVEFLLLSYDFLPPGRFPNADDLADWGVARVARTFGLGFTLAAPFVIASLIYNLALGVINRAMPQLMVAFVGAPAITAAGLILLALSLPLILQVWISAMTGFMAVPLEGRF